MIIVPCPGSRKRLTPLAYSTRSAWMLRAKSRREYTSSFVKSAGDPWRRHHSNWFAERAKGRESGQQEISTETHKDHHHWPHHQTVFGEEERMYHSGYQYQQHHQA
jgi:hypothetical protein